jgi:hypothetical protein
MVVIGAQSSPLLLRTRFMEVDHSFGSSSLLFLLDRSFTGKREKGRDCKQGRQHTAVALLLGNAVLVERAWPY